MLQTKKFPTGLQIHHYVEFRKFLTGNVVDYFTQNEKTEIQNFCESVFSYGNNCLK